MQAKDGRLIWVTTNGFPLIDTLGKLLGYIGGDNDITELKRNEIELHQAHDQTKTILNDGLIIIKFI